MNAAQLWAMVAGLFLSFVLGLLLKKSWPEWVKFIVVIAASAVVGVVDLLVAGRLHWNVGLFTLIGSVVAASQVTFFFFIEQIPGLKNWLYSQFVRDTPAAVVKGKGAKPNAGK
jgi:hypothetical protein